MPNLNLAELETIIRKNYFNTKNVLIEPLSKGVENQNFIIRLDCVSYVLRVYSQNHSTTGPRKSRDIKFELDLIAHLRGQGIPTPEARLTFDGSKFATFLVDDQKRYGVLFELVSGDEASAYNEENARSVADLLLKIRKASASFRYSSVRKWPGDIVGLSLKFYEENAVQFHQFKDVLDPLYEDTRRAYRRILNGCLPTGIIHGDIKLGNIFFEENRVKALFDFDDYRESYLLEELTRTVMHDLDCAGRNVIRSGLFYQFWEVFEREASVSVEEMHALIVFLRARFIYDVTVYTLNGYHQLVKELVEDKNIVEVILS
jgi:Ser/Thr protein kinase RdoA (MazF antagonist)